MTVWRNAAIGVAVAGLLVGVVPGWANATDTQMAPDVSGWTQADEDRYEAHIRDGLGFPSALSDLASVRASFPDSANTDGIGIPLTPQEAATVTARQALPALTDAAVAVAERLPTYGGVWMEQRGNGVMHIALTTVDPTVKALIMALVPGGVLVSIDQVTHSLAQLRGVQQQITGSEDQLATEGIDVVSVGVLQRQNQLQVALGGQSMAGSEDALRAAYPGVDISFVRVGRAVATDSRDIRTGRLFGGEIITTAIGNGFSLCSAGYAHLLDGAGNAYEVTAGHCGNVGNPVWQGRTLSGNPLGRVVKNAVVYGGSGTNCDCMVHADRGIACRTNPGEALPGIVQTAQDEEVKMSGSRTLATCRRARIGLTLLALAGGPLLAACSGSAALATVDNAALATNAAPVETRDVAAQLTSLQIVTGAPIQSKSDSWEALSPDPNSSTLNIDWVDSPVPGCGQVTTARVAETAESILIQLPFADGPGVDGKEHRCAAVGAPRRATLVLRAPIGQRRIIEPCTPAPAPKNTQFMTCR